MSPREHKYRAWHPEWKKFIFFSPLDLIWDNHVGGYRLVGNQETNECFHCFQSKDVHIHQFTGFRDINQVEVYECDIVIWPNDPALAPRYVIFDQENGFWRISGDSYDGFDSLSLALNNEFQVVGNIIENPGYPNLIL